VPIDQTVREWGDKGTPVVQAAPESSVSQAFIAIAEKLVNVIAKRAEEAGPTIDRSGGAGRKRLPISR
jgi:ATP-binding protein involved in chromosome partitioning